MCGISGFWQQPAPGMETILAQMTARLAHRGPDDSGNWCDPDAGIALGHRRLAILDLSPAGHQPMHSACGRFVLIFNGEIYNHETLRQALPLQPWRGHSDTETLLAGFAHWGIVPTLQKTVGMFALALWDKETRKLTLARDRLGEKPLYYGWQKNTFLFASELGAIKIHPAFERTIDRDALALFMRHNNVPAPYSIFQGIHKLPPGCLLTLDAHSLCGQPACPVPYWQLQDAIEAGKNTPFAGSATEAIDQLERLIAKSARLQMAADVPTGAFLSGGIDSSAIVALMQAQSATPVKTFSIGFHEQEYDEAGHARAVARHLGTEHNELYLTAADALALIPSLPHLYDEPFADASQIPTVLLARLARQQVTVCLSGDGGDELFGGYTRYPLALKLWHRLHGLPGRHLLAHGINRLPAALIDQLPAGHKLQLLGQLMQTNELEPFYQQLISYWKTPPVHGARPRTVCNTPHIGNMLPLERLLRCDTLTYLPDDVLTKVDRASMSAGLEARVPLLDHRIVEFAWRLPLALRCHPDGSKWLLRQVLYRHVPAHLVERPKMGFGVPLDHWLRGELRDWAEALLDESRLRRNELLDAKAIRKKWQEHLSGRHNWQYPLWNVLMFAAWQDSQ